MAKPADRQQDFKDFETLGLKYLGPSNQGSQFAFFEIIACGHRDNLDIQRLRREAKYFCKSCQRAKLNREAVEAGLEIIGKGRADYRFRQYRFLSCGHEQEILVAAVRKGRGFSCQACKQEKLINEAKDAGLELLGNASKSSKRKYRYLECGHVEELFTSSVRSRSFSCSECWTTNFSTLGKSKGLLYLGPDSSPRRYRFKIVSCGHELSLKTDQVQNQLTFPCKTCREDDFAKLAAIHKLRLIEMHGLSQATVVDPKCGHMMRVQFANLKNRNSVYTCPECREDEIERAASELNLKLIRKAGGGQKREVLCNSCKTKRSVQYYHLLEASFRCGPCQEIRRSAEAFEQGLELLSKVNKDYGIFKFRSCGHQKRINFQAVREGQIQCKICIEDRYIDEANRAGLQYIGRSKKGQNHRQYKCLKCDRLIDLGIRAVADDSFLCKFCGDSARQKASEVYLLRLSSNDGLQWLKLGFSKNVELRIKQYGLPNDVKVEFVKRLAQADGYLANEKENAIHNAAQEFRLPAALMMQYHIKSGFSECYSLEAEPIIMALMNK